MFAGGKWDTFRMLTHPGTSIIPAALVAAEAARRFGQGVHHRRRRGLRSDGAHGRGLHPDGHGARLPRRAGVRHLRRGRGGRKDHGPERRPDEQLRSRCARIWRPATSKARAAARRCAKAPRCATRCWRSRWRSRDTSAAAKRCSKAKPASITPTPATTWASSPTASGEHADQPRQAHRRASAQDWMFLETLYRIYSIAGYNIAHIDVTARLCEEHDISPRTSTASRRW